MSEFLTRVRPLRLFFWLRRKGYRLAAVQRRYSSVLFSFLFAREYRGRISFQSIEVLASEENARWSRLPESEVRLTIVVVTYQQPQQLECLLGSLACQTLQNFEVIVLHDGAHPETKTVVGRFAERSGRFRYVETEIRHNDYGHSLRAMGIEMAKGEFLLITNGDNYYTPRFSEFVFDAIESHGLDIVVWDIVHSYNGPGKIQLTSYNAFRVYPVRWMVDISSIMVRTVLAKTTGFVDRTHSGDATYVEGILASAGKPLKLGKVEKVLSVHN